MRVCPDKPCGGGARFAIKLGEYLTSQGHTIEYSFDERRPPDCILFFDHKTYADDTILKWIGLEEAKVIKSKLPNIPIITRVNDIGAPKNRPPDFVERFCELANLSNHVVYVSEWLRNDYYFGKIKSPSSVIHNSADENVFTIKDHSFDKPRLFTHHWAPNRMKGWDIYEQIDDWIPEKEIEFTFAGNLPNNTSLRNSRALPPITGTKLADEIRKHNIYITASKHEPCGNHYIEGIACGLPYLYSTEGGGTKECGQFGLEFRDFEDFKIKLEEITKDHRLFYDKIKKDFEHYNKNTFKKYEEIMLKLT
jgi:hypothetical protein